MFEFGAGTLWGYPVGGNTAANPTPIKFATLQDVSLDISGDLKELYGQKQFPEAVARGKMKVTGKAKYAWLNGKQMNDLFFGQTLGTGTKSVALDEQGTITAGSITVVNSAQFVQDWGVRYKNTGLPLTFKTTPAIGQYSQAAGVYTFNVGENATIVLISYTFTVAGSGTQLNIANQLMGFAPTIQMLLETVYNNQQFTVLLYSCVAAKLMFATKQEDFLVPELDFQAFANAAGQVIDIYSAE